MNLIQRIVELERKIAEQERRNRNRRRTGVITEVDHDKGLARVKFSDKPRVYKSAWLPWQEVSSGAIKTHFAPAVGEQVDVISENGDLTDACIEMSTPSDKNPRPHKGPEPVITYGSVRLQINQDHVELTGNLKVKGNVDVIGAGTYVKHNDHRIDEKHKHTEVEPGNGLSGIPL